MRTCALAGCGWEMPAMIGGADADAVLVVTCPRCGTRNLMAFHPSRAPELEDDARADLVATHARWMEARRLVSADLETLRAIRSDVAEALAEPVDVRERTFMDRMGGKLLAVVDLLARGNERSLALLDEIQAQRDDAAPPPPAPGNIVPMRRRPT